MKFHPARFLKILYGLLFASVYIDAPLLIGGVIIPSAYGVVVSIPFILLQGRSFLHRQFLPLFYCILLFGLSATILSPAVNATEKLLGLIQITAAICIAYSFYNYSYRHPEEFSSFLRISLLLILSFSILEVFDITKVISDEFRSRVFREDLVSYLYSSSERDLALVGFDRPKVFSAEPSYVSLTYFVLAIASVKLDSSNKNLFLTIGGGLIMSALMQSPIVFLTLPIIFYIKYGEPAAIKFNAAYKLIISIAFFLLFFGYPLALDLAGRPLNYDAIRFGDFSSINSQTIRFVLPWTTASDVLGESPWFGAGLSGKSAIEAFSSFGYSAQVVMGTNNIANIFMYLGLIGSSVFFLLTFIFAKNAGGVFTPSLSFILIAYSSMLGGFETIRYWMYAFLILAAYKASTPALTEHNQ